MRWHRMCLIAAMAAGCAALSGCGVRWREESHAPDAFLGRAEEHWRASGREPEAARWGVKPRVFLGPAGEYRVVWIRDLSLGHFYEIYEVGKDGRSNWSRGRVEGRPDPLAPEMIPGWNDRLAQ